MTTQSYRISKPRAFILFSLWLAVFVLFSARLAHLQFFHPRNLHATAQKQSQLIQEISPYRGKILDRNQEELALDVRVYSLGANARRIKHVEPVVQQLKVILDLDPEYLRERLSRDKSFVWIKRKLTKSQTEQVRALGMDFFELRPEWQRIYPSGGAAGHLVGFTGLDHYGLEGIEYLFDSHLKGIPGWKSTLKDAMQRELVARQKDYVAPVDGYNVVLTLDVVIQHMAEKVLTATCKKYSAMAGSIVVMDAKNGDVLAMANYPSFDPNEFSKSPGGIRRNRSITDLYEPGSVFKIFTVAAALEEGVVGADDKIHCENGAYRTGGRILHDVHPYGSLKVREIVSKSSNIGTAKIAQKLGKEKLYEHLINMGFAQRTGIDLPGEIGGILRPPRKWSATSISSVPMGQEVGVTALQLATAVNSIANGGWLLKPRVVLRIQNPKGEMIKEHPSLVKRRVLSKETSDKMKIIMREVVEKGTGRNAVIPGAVVGGKTGTAQKLEPNGSYSHEHFIASFAGYVEKDDNLITILVSIDDPKPKYYGGTVAAPAFQQLGEKILEYWQ